MYGLIHAVKLSSAMGLGNIHRLDESIDASLQWVVGPKQFSSHVEDRMLDGRRIRMDDGDVDEISDSLKKNLLQFLLIDLASLADELLAEILTMANKCREDYRYLRNKVNAVVCKSREEWAQKGVLELNILRNCIVHSNARWNDEALAEIRSICGSVSATSGDPLTLNYGDIFRYKRAVRTLLNQAEQNGFMP